MRYAGQITLGLDPLPKKTRKEVFLDEMNRVVPWAALMSLIQPHGGAGMSAPAMQRQALAGEHLLPAAPRWSLAAAQIPLHEPRATSAASVDGVLQTFPRLFAAMTEQVDGWREAHERH